MEKTPNQTRKEKPMTLPQKLSPFHALYTAAELCKERRDSERLKDKGITIKTL